jgi:hypothetical protein
MSFLNQKEQVINLVLTKHGKEQISKGLFAPKFYSFVDDDILYDSSNASFSEVQNDAQKRIIEETPKTNILISDAEPEDNKNKPYIADLPYREKDLYKSFNGLSNSELGNQTAPRFNYICLKNKISSSALIKTVGSSSYNAPQLNFDLNVFAIRQSVDSELIKTAKLSEEINGEIDLYAPEQNIIERDQVVTAYESDNTILKVRRGRTIGLLLEEGGSKVNDTFELEFFLMKKQLLRVSGVGADSVFETIHTYKKLDPNGSFGEETSPNALEYYLDVQTEENLFLEPTTGFSISEGVYDNLPQVDEDFCK